MTREEAKRAAEVMLAFAEGKSIQLRWRGSNMKWTGLVLNPLWNWRDFDYRVKPEPLEIWGKVYRDGEIITERHKANLDFLTKEGLLRTAKFREVIED